MRRLAAALIAVGLAAGPGLAQDTAWQGEVLALADELGQAFRAETGMDLMQPRVHPRIRLMAARQLGLDPDVMDQRVRAGYAMSSRMLDMRVHEPVRDRASFGTTAQGIRWGIVPFRVQAQQIGQPALPETCALFLIFNADAAWFVHDIGKPKSDATLYFALPDLSAALPTKKPDCTGPVS